MKLAKFMLILLVTVLAVSCKSLQWTPIENTNLYRLEKGKNKIFMKARGTVTGTMQWNKKDDACTANFFVKEKSFCFNYRGRPDYLIEITENGNCVGSINSINKHVSILQSEEGEYTLRPIKGKIVAFYFDNAIARIYTSKRELFLEITAEHENNLLLTAALIYKDWEWQKSNNYAEDWWIWIVLLLALM